MTVRNLILLAGLSASLIGCVAYPPPYYAGGYNNQYGNDYYDYRDTPSYQGYYYARIIFIGSIPYYVDGDHQIHQIPPRYRDHFSRYPYQNLHRPPVFSRDKEVLIDASTAEAWGLVSKVVPGEKLMDEAMALAASIAKQPPHALRVAKQLLRHGTQATYDTIMEMSAAAQGLMHHTKDHEEGVAAILEKREPKFTGE